MRRIGLLGLGLVAILTLTACGGTTVPQKVEGAGSAAPDGGQARSERPQPQVFAVGDTIKMGDLQFTVNSVRTTKGEGFVRAKDGNVYVLVNATVENIGDKPAAISSLLMFKLQDGDGYQHNITIYPDAKGSLDGEVAPGRKMRGELAFEVPEHAKGLELLFEPNLMGFGQAIIKLD
ncbi:MAG: DUF4352 domain-containing protein [Bacillota bacterium]